MLVSAIADAAAIVSATVTAGSEKGANAPISRDVPALAITEVGGRIRLNLGGFAHGEGSSLQEAADDLICSILRLVMAFRSTGFRTTSEFPPDLETMSFLYELGEIAAAGGDIRPRVFA
jgi:hypothetical protein